VKAIVTGMIATYPVGGVVWDYGQYALGLERLGFEVYYVEDTGWQVYDPDKREYGEDYAYGVRYLEDALAALSPTLAARWHVRAMDGRTFGVDTAELAETVATADLFLNVSGGTLLRDEYMACRRKVLIDTDPGWNHFVNYPRADSGIGWRGSHGYRAHDHFFTYAELLGRPECVLPSLGISWHPTRPPVVVDCWEPQEPGRTWTTVMTWDNFRRPIEHDGIVYGTKEGEFVRIERLPHRVGVPLEIAVGGSDVPRERWKELGWSVVDSHAVSQTPQRYRDYIQASRGEFSVAKNVYVATRSGWFSCRSVCYLAAGRPVVVQNTGFSTVLPTGKGILAFSSLEEAVRGIEDVEADYATHQRAARELARTHFDSASVLTDMLDRIGLG
jgi:hypothetical protein